MSAMATQQSQSLICPDCGQKGVKVQSVTLQSLLKPEAKERIGDGPYRFCESPECDTVYYSESLPPLPLGWSLPKFSSTPTGLRPPAQGCEALRATLGSQDDFPVNAEGVASMSKCLRHTGVYGRNPVGVEDALLSNPQGCEALRATLGSQDDFPVNAEGVASLSKCLRHTGVYGRNPVGVEDALLSNPQGCSKTREPWAGRRNTFGVQEGKMWAKSSPLGEGRGKGSSIFTKSDLTVRVGIKEADAPRHVCYCFDHTIEEIDDEVQRTGRCTVPDDIKERMKEACWCETMSPRGSCCLGTVNRYVGQALARIKKAGETPASWAETGLHSCCRERDGESAISRAKQRMIPRSRWFTGVAGLLAGVFSLLPTFTCPVCWPAYAALLSALGLGFLLDSAYLVPLIILFLGVTLFGLAFRARQRRGLRPFALGFLGSGAILGANSLVNSTSLLYVGIALVVGASLWNSWPRKKARACPSCVTPTAHVP